MKRAGRISWLVLVMGVFATALGVAFVAFSERARDQRQLDSRAADLAAALHERIELYEAALFATQSYFQAFPGEITSEDFAEYVNGLALGKRLPGILGIGFARLVWPDEARAFEDRKRSEGNEGWRIWPRSQTEPMFPIVMFEPDVEASAKMMGFNMFSEHVRREAMQRARDTGQAAMSESMTLRRDRGRDPSPGFLIFAPVSASPDAPKSGAFIGFVYAPFHVRDFLFDAFANTRASDLRIKLFDGATPSADHLMYESDERECDALHALVTTEVGGRVWTIQVARGKGFVRRSIPGPAPDGGCGRSACDLLVVRHQSCAGAGTQAR